MPRSERIELRWTPELLAKVDAARGDVPRNRFIERAVESALSGLSLNWDPEHYEAEADLSGIHARRPYVKPFKPNPKAK